MKHERYRLGGQQAGFASIVIALILILVLSLSTVGFATLMRNEQDSALNKHLSSQAYYSAESGINDAALAINQGFTGKKNYCGPWRDAAVAGSQYLGSDRATLGNAGIGYSCLMIDPTPPTVEFANVDNDTNSHTFIITGVNANDSNTPESIHRIVIGWQPSDSNAGASFRGGGINELPKSGSWGANTGVLRVGLTPISTGEVTRNAMASNFFAAFLYPKGSGGASAPGTISYGSNHGSNAGTIVDGKCNTGNPGRAAGDSPRYCNVEINGLDSTNFLVDLRSIYTSSRVTVLAYGGDSDTQVLIKNAQTVVDATGKAQGVLKRVQVRVPSKDTYVASNYALETSDDICKQYELTPDTDAKDNCANP